MNAAAEAFERAVAAERIRAIIADALNVAGVVAVLYLTICAFAAAAR